MSKICPYRTNISQLIRKVLRSSFSLEKKLDATVEKLLAFNSVIDDIARVVDPDLRYFYLALKDQFNKTQIFDVHKAHSSFLLPSKYSKVGQQLKKKLLVSLMADLKFEGYQYQFVRAQFFSSIVEHYYLKDVENALQSNDPAILKEYNRFKQRGLLYSLFPDLGTLIRAHLLPEVSNASLCRSYLLFGAVEPDHFILYDR